MTFEIFFRHDEGVRENRGVLGVQPMEGFERQFHFHPARDVKESARPNECFVQRGKLGRAERRRLAHEMAPEQFFVLDHGALERLEDDAGFAEFFGKDVALQEMIVGKNEATGSFVETCGTLEDFAAIRGGQWPGGHERRQIERADGGETPGLIGPDRHWQTLELRPRHALLVGEPSRQLVVAAALVAAENTGGFRFDGGLFFENSGRVAHSGQRRERRSRDRRQTASVSAGELSRQSLPSQVRSGA